MTAVMGLDLSLTKPGVALPGLPPTVNPTKGLDGMQRLGALRDMVIHAVAMSKPDVIVIEGYSFGSGFKAHQLGEVGGVVRLWLAENQVHYVNVAPATLKKFATGKGNAGKFDMHSAAEKAAPEITFKDDNAVDAWWLQRMGETYFNELSRNQKQDEALAKVDWHFSEGI